MDEGEPQAKSEPEETKTGSILVARQEKIKRFLTEKPTYLVYALLALIAWFGYYIRTRNLGLLIDATTGKYIPADPDAIGILRYVKYVVENGQLMSVDTMRYVPFGFSNMEEFAVISHAVAYFYKILHFFSSTVTVEFAHIVYPAVAFVIALIFFFLFLKKVFDWKVALLGSAFLTVVPAYLFRTMSGISDKEALAMVFFYATMYFFMSMIEKETFKKGVVWAICGGVALGLTWLTWGGVQSLLILTGVFAIGMIFFDRFSNKTLATYTLFVGVALAIFGLGFPARFSIGNLAASITTGVLFLVFPLWAIHHFLFQKDLLKIKSKVAGWGIPLFYISLGIVAILAILVLSIVSGPGILAQKLTDLYTNLVSPFASDRWILTVAESHQPYFIDWVSQLSWKYLLIVFAGAVLLFYEAFKSIGKKVYLLTGGFAVFIAFFTMSRYSSSSPTFNGETTLSIATYIGSLLFFVILFAYTFWQLHNKDPDYKQKISGIKLEYAYILILFVILIIGARSAIRLLFLFSPATAILAGFFFVAVATYAADLKDKMFRNGALVVIGVVAVFMLYSFSQATLAQAQYVGPGFNSQWQYAMDWVRENTEEDAVFAHWWDYGYYVQTFGERATLSDGGNALGGINHFIGRHLLTGQNETEALELLFARNATHVLIVSDEIGKYGAYSSIGADANYDRYSWIPVFTLDMSQTQETRNGTNLVYVGGTALDDDFLYNGQLFPAYSAGVAGIIVPVTTDTNGTTLIREQPTAILSYNGQYFSVPLECIFLNGEELTFEQEGLPACFQIIPRVSGGQADAIGAGFYLSPEVYKTLFTHLYLFGEQWDYMKLVYSDEASFPFIIYEGYIVGPLKIWEVSYPEDIEPPEEYYGTEIPVEVTIVRR